MVDGLVSITGSGSLTTVGGANSLSVQLTGLTNHSVLVGAGTSTITSLSVGATGTVLAGSTGADPSFTATPSVTSITLSGGNALSAYTEQTAWSPTIIGGTVAGAGTYTAQNGYYTRIGNMIFASCVVIWTAHTGTGDMLLGNLPFAARNSTNYNPEGIVNPTNITLPGGATSVRGSVAAGATSMVLSVLRSNNTNDPVQMSNAGTIHMTIAYLT